MRPTGRLLPALLLLLVLAGCGGSPVEPKVEEGYAFIYRPPAGASVAASVSVRGSFNGWGETPMTKQPDGSWKATIKLEPGTHEYKFFINGAWPADMCHDRSWGDPARDYWIHPDATTCVADGHGGRNAVLIVGEVGGLAFSHAPADPAQLSLAGGRLSVRFRAGLGQVQGASVVVGVDTVAMHHQLTVGLDEIWRAALPEATTTYSVTLRTKGGVQAFGPYTVPANLFRSVNWVGPAVGYQIFPERFWNGDPTNDEWTLKTDVVNYMNPKHWNVQPVLMKEWGGEVLEFHCCHQYFGGDLQGIIDKLNHLDALGVTLIYMNPIFTSGSAHGYDTFDYLQVKPSFGDEAVLRRLLDEAHARGMRVMWDFVPNHVGVGHWAFQDAVKNGEASPYWNWFLFKVPAGQVEVGHGGHYDSWWGFGSLPRLQTRNPAVSKHLLDAARHWTQFGFDGIRVDVPNEIANRSEFFPAFRQATKAINPEVYLVGEIWERDPSWLKGDQFDALMNYALGSGVIERFAKGGMAGGGAAYELAQIYSTYPEASVAMQFNLISSHDTDRLLTKMGGGALGGTPDATALARHRLASAMLYAVPGMPVTFQGDECAFLGSGEGPREENRYPMQWSACDAGMVAHYARLAGLKRTVGAISSPVIRAYRSAGPLLSFYRGEPGPGEVLAVFNNGQSSQTLVLPGGNWTDAASGQLVSGSAEVAALGWRYLERR